MTFSAIDLSAIPPPDIVEEVDAETIIADAITSLKALDALFTATVESDPLYKLLEEAAYIASSLRQRVNNAARAIMLPSAVGGDLDQIAARYNVARLLIDAGDPDAIPPIAPTYESDTALKRRTQLAFEGLSTAGPVGAYQFHALSADGDVKDALPVSPSAGYVTVSVLSNTGNGTAGSGLLATVDAVLSSDDVRPLTDFVTVQSATIIEYTITADLYFYEGPDTSGVLANAQAAVEAFVDAAHKIDHSIVLTQIIGALQQVGVAKVDLTLPAADITVADDEAAYCTSITLTNAGIFSD